MSDPTFSDIDFKKLNQPLDSEVSQFPLEQVSKYVFHELKIYLNKIN